MTSRKGYKEEGGGVGEGQMWRQRQTTKPGSSWRDVCGNSYWLATGIDRKTLKDLTF